MPQYMLLIYQPVDNPLTPEQLQETGPRWDAYTKTLQDAGALVAGDALERPDVGTTVRERGGRTQFTDGPFAETKEFLAGYYLLEAPDLDTVLEHAGRAPNLGHGAIEVRPIWDTGQATEATGQARAQA
ncbi:MAG: hypothetical protein JOY56_00725 [Solirubrobacterales bacterium]|nr:hypothetical protein [Solirubrobacterales bacterium]